MSTNMVTKKGRIIDEPGWVKWLLSTPQASWIWFPLRVWVGWQWIQAAQYKIFNPAWVETGYAVKGFWEQAIVIPEGGRPPITFDWYRGFIQSMLDVEAYTWLAPLVAYGELLVGITLVLGIFTGISAFFGALMNWNFMMAGPASSNPMLFMIAIGLMMAWKVAGYIGIDYFLLPWIGTPWRTEKAKLAPEAVPIRA